jgi:hypothetical protein
MELHPSVIQFFHEAVTQSLSTLKIDASERTEFYLVNLLADFTKNQVDDQPLAIKMAQTNQGTPEERLRGLKQIGDTTLYMSGFFADSLTRKLVDRSYYIAMGGSAYSQLAGMTTQIRDVYDELARKFAMYVEVLTDIRRNTNFAGGMNILRLYEEWVKTGSAWVEERLRESGVVSLPKKKHTH